MALRFMRFDFGCPKFAMEEFETLFFGEEWDV
jgi:hypothetical protein